MRALPLAGALLLLAAGSAIGQPAAPMPPPPPPAAYVPPPAYPPPAAPPPTLAQPAELHRSWFAAIGAGPMGYAGREYTPYDDGNKGTGGLLEAVAGKWLDNAKAIGARIEAHTDDAKHYTDSSFTVIARFPVAARGRFYLEPAVGLGFHKDEMSTQTDTGFAVGMVGGYQLTRRHFACDLRFGGAHLRFDTNILSHGLLWVGLALGFQ